MITIIPTLEIMRSVTDMNITSSGAEIRRESFDMAMELKSLGDVKILLEGILYERLKDRINEDHQVFFESTCTIDNSAKNVTDYNITKAINWIAKSESQIRKVIILTENQNYFSEAENGNVIIITPTEFIYKTKKILEFVKGKALLSIDEVLLALFFL